MKANPNVIMNRCINNKNCYLVNYFVNRYKPKIFTLYLILIEISSSLHVYANDVSSSATLISCLHEEIIREKMLEQRHFIDTKQVRNWEQFDFFGKDYWRRTRYIKWKQSYQVCIFSIFRWCISKFLSYHLLLHFYS